MIKLILIQTKIPKMPTIEAIIDNRKLYLYSKYDPSRDSLAFAEEVYDKAVKNYVIYGLGLGYHIDALIDLINREDYHIYIFECNRDIFKLAKENINLDKILNNSNITIVIMENEKSYYEKLNNILVIEGIKIGIHKPSLRIIPEEFKELKYLFEEFQMIKNTIDSNFNILDKNFKENIKNFYINVDDLFNKLQGKSIYIVSAGPSLDKNIHELIDVQDNGIILSVGRAVRPLLAANITLDFIIITDPSEYLYDMQLKGLDIEMPIIVLSTCDKNVMLKYKGPKYIALQEGYNPAEIYAKENGHTVVRTGGSVATTALDVAIKMGGNPIVFVGQDLGFTDNKTHAKDTYSRDIFDSQSLRNIEGIDGDIIQTSKNLYIYLRWIQNRIAEENNIEFIDATEGGARIKGTKVMKLRDVIRS